MATIAEVKAVAKENGIEVGKIQIDENGNEFLMVGDTKLYRVYASSYCTYLDVKIEKVTRTRKGMTFTADECTDKNVMILKKWIERIIKENA